MPESVPPLDALAADPSQLASLPRTTLLDLLRVTRLLAVELEHALAARQPEPVLPVPDGASPDRRLTPPEAAAYLGVSLRWLRQRDVPGKIKLGHRTVVYSAKALEKYLRQRAAR
jgi:predicted DNA-binding transcriptional regulator AlpA